MTEQNETAATEQAQDNTPVVNGSEFKYFFKKTKLKDDSGNVVGEGRKHPDVVATFPVPTTEEIVSMIASGGPASKLIVDAIYDTIFQAGRQQIYNFLESNPDGTFTANDFDLSKLTLEQIALIPKKERGAWAPSEEDLKDFNEDYKETMVTLVGYDPKKVGTHCKNFEKGLVKIKADKAILAKVKELLVVYAANTQNMEEFQQTYDWFVARIDKWSKLEEKVTVDAF